MPGTKASRETLTVATFLCGAVAAAAILSSACGGRRPADEDVAYYDFAAKASVAEFESGGSDLTEPIVDTGSQTLFLPAGSGLAFSLFVEEGSRFQAERVTTRASRLEVTLDTDDGDSGTVAIFAKPSHDASADLPVSTRTPARLTLSVLPTSETSEASETSKNTAGVLIQGAALWSTQPRPQPKDPVPATREAANVLIYLVDTLRQDRLGAYGYDSPVSPALDAFTSTSTLYANAIGQSSWTKASVASLFTGVWPPTHGALGWKHRLPEQFETLPEILSKEGYQTAAFVTNANVSPAFGFEQGFESFVEKVDIRSDEVNELVFDWLEGRDRDRPFFLYVHTIDPHGPYLPPEPFRTRFAPKAVNVPDWKPNSNWRRKARPHLGDLYDGEIAANDESFGALVAKLSELEILDDLMLVFVSDHGEEFREHGAWGHGRNLHAETLNFPLVVKHPGQSTGNRVDTPVQHIDILPAVLERLGLPTPDLVEGDPLPEADAESLEARRIYSHLEIEDRPHMDSVVDGDWKLIRHHRRGGIALALYDWKADPGETDNLAERFPIRAAAMSASIEEHLLRGSTEAQEVAIDEETERTLRALGYLQ